MKDRKYILLITPVITFLKQWPVHIILLPVFFVLSVYTQLSGLLTSKEFSDAFLKIAGSSLILFMLLLVFYRNKAKAGLVTTIFGIIFLFFGNIKEMLYKTPFLLYISSYTVLLPLLFVLVIVLLIKIRKVKSFPRATLFFNTLFILYLLIEIWNLKKLQYTNKTATDPNIETISAQRISQKQPDIYYIVLDCYPSSRYQQDVLGASPNFLDSFLLQKKFFVLQNSRSNYQITSFSIAATLNMKYLDWMEDVIQAKPSHYSRACNEVKQSVSLALLVKYGYKIYNLSIFDLPGQPSLDKGRFFTASPGEFIFHNTLWNQLKWHVIPALIPSFTKKLDALQIKNNQELLGGFKQYNQRVIDSLQYLPVSQKTVSPKFIYAHIEMPHYPFFFDSTGKSYPDNETFSPSASRDKNKFRNYIAYTNKVAAAFIDSILLRSDNKSVIIVQSDHGTANLDLSRHKDAFSNYSAFYFPDKDYRLLYDSMSNVNTFRVIFNKYFNQRLPLLKDTSIILNNY